MELKLSGSGPIRFRVSLLAAAHGRSHPACHKAHRGEQEDEHGSIDGTLAVFAGGCGR